MDGNPAGSGPDPAQQYRYLAAAARAAQEALAAEGDAARDETLVQASWALAVRALAAHTWDDDCRSLLERLERRLPGPAARHPTGTGRVRELLVPVAHTMLLLARSLIPWVDPLRHGADTADLAAAVERGGAVLAWLEDPAASADPAAAQLAGPVHGLVGLGLLMLASAADDTRAGADLLSRAKGHLARGPVELQQGAQDVIDAMVLGQPAGEHRPAWEELGLDVAEVYRLVQRADQTRALADIDAAVVRARAARAGLPAGHGMHQPLLSMTAHLRALRASLTLSAEDAGAAVHAGVHAVQAAVEPDFGSVHPLTESLLVSVTADARGGPRLPAEEALRAFLGRDALDPLARLSATIGLGAALALRWAGGPDTHVRDSARAVLQDAQGQALQLPVSIEAVQLELGLIQLNLAMAAIWGEPSAPEAVTRLATPLEATLRADPALAQRLDALMPHGPGGFVDLAPAMGLPPGLVEHLIPGASSEPGLVGMLATLRQMMPLLGAFLSATSSGPLAALYGSRLPFAASADPMLAAARQRLADPGAPLDLGALAAAALADARGDETRFREKYAKATGTPATPAPPSTQVADTRMNEALARARRLLDDRRRPLARQDRPAPDALRALTGELRAALADVTDPDLRHQAHDLLGVGLAELYWAGAGDPALLDEAAGCLERARETDPHGLPSPRRADLLDVQACCLAELGRRGRGPEATGQALAHVRAALRELGRCVLLQPDASAALGVAARADRIVARALAWSLETGRHADAVSVVEAGRGLVLAAATASGRVAELLTSLGETDAAQAWRRGTPDDLERAFAVLSGTPEGVALLRSPMAYDVSMTLHAGRLDAVAYLIPPGRIDPEPPGTDPEPPGTGWALVVLPGFVVDVVPLPEVTCACPPVVSRYRDCYAAALDSCDDGAADAEFGFRSSPGGRAWARALDDLGAWAYRAVLRPLLHRFDVATAGAPAAVPLRLALVPVGDLGAVPYAAAWKPERELPGGRRYAVHDVVLSQAASGRLLGEVATRSRLPIRTRPVILLDPTGGLFLGRLAGRALADRLYPNAEVYGPGAKDGPGDPDRVLAALAPAPRDAGPASVLHLITHAQLPPDAAADPLAGTLLHVGPAPEPATGDSPPQDGPAWLSLRRILTRARRSGPAGGHGLVICDACVTDLTAANRDESLTIATAFLAAGAAGAIGTRWPVDDDTSALLAYVLQHHLAAGLAPGDALREAQLWLIGPARPTIPGLPWQLAEELRPGRWAEPASWAAYTYHGC